MKQVAILPWGKPHVGQRDMGLWKPVKYFYWCPWPVWYSKKGTPYYVSRKLFLTQSAAEAALRIQLKTREGKGIV